MKAIKESRNLKGRWMKGLVKATLGMALCVPVAAVAIDAVVLGSAPADNQPEMAPAAIPVPPRYSTGVGDVLKMADAKVDPRSSRLTSRVPKTRITPV